MRRCSTLPGRWWDDRLSDKDYEILGRSLSRALKWREGQINVSVSEERDASLQIQFNFHRASTKIDDLKRWLSTPCADLEDQCRQILLDSMKVTPEDWDYAVAAAEA